MINVGTPFDPAKDYKETIGNIWSSMNIECDNRYKNMFTFNIWLNKVLGIANAKLESEFEADPMEFNVLIKERIQRYLDWEPETEE